MESMDELLFRLAFAVGQASQADFDIWKDHVVSIYANLAVAKIQAWLAVARDWAREGTWKVIELITCNMDYFNALLGDEETIDCPIDSQDWPDDEEWDFDDDDEMYSLEERDLVKRGRARKFTRMIANARRVIQSWNVSAHKTHIMRRPVPNISAP
jgi:chitinase